jgi:hypothetical protein
MNSWFRGRYPRPLWKRIAGRSGRQQRQASLGVERLEDRCVPSAAQHVLFLSVDGLHNADIADPALQSSMTSIRSLENNGVTFTNAHTTSPSDSFPGTLSYLTAAGPGTTGVYYDDSYSRTLLPPTALGGGSTPGTEAQYAENIDKISAQLDGGGNFDASSIDPTQLPRDPNTGNPVFPNQFLKVNTIFDVAHQAGLYTAFSDKHPAYQIADGTDPKAINDFYAPEINSITALYDPILKMTVDANALLAANPFTDVSKYVLVDPSTDPMGPSDPNLINDTTHNVLLTERYDDLKVQAILNEIAGKASHLSPDITNPQVPALFGMNFQAVSVAQKFAQGGINLLPNGQEGAPSDVLKAAIQHTDASIGKIIDALKSAGLWNTTEMVVTAKHGQAPRVGIGGVMSEHTLPDLLANAGTPTAFAVQDDVSLIYLQDQSQTALAVKTLENFKQNASIDVFFQGTKVTLPASQIIDKILSGPGLVNAGLGNPATDSTTPDIIVTLKEGYLWVSNGALKNKAAFKRAEHGGFSDADTHIALIVSGGSLDKGLDGTTQTEQVSTKQIAVSALEALGLNPNKLQGAVIEGTKALPGLGLPVGIDHTVEEGKTTQLVVATFVDPDNSDAHAFNALIHWGDGKTSEGHVVAGPNHTFFVVGTHRYGEEGTFQASVSVSDRGESKGTAGFQIKVVEEAKGSSPKQEELLDAIFAELNSADDLLGWRHSSKS